MIPDGTCILMPRSSLLTPNKGLKDRVIGALVTRLDQPPALVRRHLPSQLEHWAKLRILNDGDTIHAAEMVKRTEDRRDQTFVRYETYIDIHADDPNKESEYELQTFYGRLEHIIAVHIDRAAAVKVLGLDKATMFILAAIRTCSVEDTRTNEQLDIHYYREFGTLDVLNVTCIQCCVGRVPAGPQRWAIVDRSGSLARALAVDDE
ncbi:hypothetical protein LXA43DRAFT_900469 [Ganoderma leucocontextum]|nr:hypothetical protein LXA43DRAFT_900469 [Ganoderma leucocontextum]